MILDFNGSDAIDFVGTATTASYAGGALTLYDGTAAVATLNLAGDYAGESFNTSPVSVENGLASGTEISLDPNSGDDPPGVEAPMEETASTGEPLAISSVGITDSTSGASLSVTLSDSGGFLTVTTNAPGGGGAITGSGGKNVTISGTLAQINADLSTLSYMSSTVGSDSILVSANDGLGGLADAEISVTVSGLSASARYRRLHGQSDMGSLRNRRLGRRHRHESRWLGAARDGGKTRLDRCDRPTGHRLRIGVLGRLGRARHDRRRVRRFRHGG